MFVRRARVEYTHARKITPCFPGSIKQLTVHSVQEERFSRLTPLDPIQSTVQNSIANPAPAAESHGDTELSCFFRDTTIKALLKHLMGLPLIHFRGSFQPTDFPSPYHSSKHKFYLSLIPNTNSSILKRAGNPKGWLEIFHS